MATAKKKTSAKRTAKTTKPRAAKRTVKYAAKTQNAAARATSHATQSATRTGNEWVKKGAAEWQKGANEWAKQSAKMYQFPFAQGDAGDAAKNAADMMKMGSDMMQQMFSQTKKATSANEAFNPSAMMQHYMPSMQQFDPASAQEKFSSFTRSGAEQMGKSFSGFNRTMNEAMDLARENGEVMMEVTNIAVSVSKELGAEFVTYMNKLFSQNVELSKQVLSCRTLNDMFDLSSRVMKTNLDGFFSESVKMSEMLFQCATDVSEPLNERMSETTERMTRAMAA